MAFRLRRYLRNPNEKEFFGLFPRQIYITDFFRPSRFTEEGQPLRRAAAACSVAGVILFLLAAIFG